MTLDNILEEIKKAEKIAILTHETPDGDAIGSSLAFKLAIKQLGKDADVIIPKYSRTFLISGWKIITNATNPHWIIYSSKTSNVVKPR